MLTHDPWQGGEGSSERRGSAITQNGSNLSPDAIWAFANNELIVSGPNGTAGIFATYPSGHLDMVNGFFDQFIGTAALIVCVLAIVDPYNNPVPRGLEAFTVGLVVLVIGTSMGFNSGYAVNPARDFGPRLFTALAGWGSEVFT